MIQENVISQFDQARKKALGMAEEEAEEEFKRRFSLTREGGLGFDTVRYKLYKKKNMKDFTEMVKERYQSNWKELKTLLLIQQVEKLRG